MKNYATRILSTLVALLIICTSALGLGACSKKEDPRANNNNPDSPYIYDKYGNTTPKPTDNDITGWFSVEVLVKYGLHTLTLPSGTEVYSKTDPDTLFLKGGKDALATTATYVHTSILSASGTLYSPVITTLEDGTAKVTSLEKNFLLDTDTLYPKGEDTSVIFVYKINRTIYQCNVSLEKNAEGIELVCISFSDKTSEYKDLV